LRSSLSGFGGSALPASLTDLEQIKQADPLALALAPRLLLARLHHQAKRQDARIRELESLIQDAPESDAALEALTRAYIELKRFADADRVVLRRPDEKVETLRLVASEGSGSMRRGAALDWRASSLTTCSRNCPRSATPGASPSNTWPTSTVPSGCETRTARAHAPGCGANLPSVRCSTARGTTRAFASCVTDLRNRARTGWRVPPDPCSASRSERSQRQQASAPFCSPCEHVPCMHDEGA